MTRRLLVVFGDHLFVSVVFLFPASPIFLGLGSELLFRGRTTCSIATTDSAPIFHGLQLKHHYHNHTSRRAIQAHMHHGGGQERALPPQFPKQSVLFKQREWEVIGNQCHVVAAQDIILRTYSTAHLPSQSWCGRGYAHCLELICVKEYHQISVPLHFRMQGEQTLAFGS